jgi:hypothetical protein
LIPNHHEGYISWEMFERIAAMISQNSIGGESPGAARRGSALLVGLLHCRRCGRKLIVTYTGRDHDVLRYVCHRGYLDNGEAKCIAFGGLGVDQAIVREVLEVVQPAAVEAAVEAHQQTHEREDQVLKALECDLEAARYEAGRAQKQYDSADPDNRLVTEELERRWNQALERVRELETRIGEHLDARPTCSPVRLEEFQNLAEDLKAVWDHPQTDNRLRKRVVRTLIEDVVADIDAESGEIILVIHWKGGVHTQLRLPRRRRGQAGSAPEDIVAAVRMLALIGSDDIIASTLNRNNLRTGRGNRWTRQRVTSLRTYHKIPVYCEENQLRDGWMNLTQAARCLGVSPKTLRIAVERGEIKGQHPLAEGAWIFNRRNLETEEAKAVGERARSRNGSPAGPNSKQENLGF